MRLPRTEMLMLVYMRVACFICVVVSSSDRISSFVISRSTVSNDSAKSSLCICFAKARTSFQLVHQMIHTSVKMSDLSICALWGTFLTISMIDWTLVCRDEDHFESDLDAGPRRLPEPTSLASNCNQHRWSYPERSQAISRPRYRLP